MSQLKYLFETERLGVRPTDPTCDSDVQAMLSLFHSQASQKSFGKSVLDMNYEACKNFAQKRWDEMYKVYGYGSFLAFRKPASQDGAPVVVGTCTLVKEPDADFPDIGYALLDEAIGKGYATEAAQGLIKYCRENCGLGDVTGYTRTDNSASRKSLERIGLRLVACVNVKYQDSNQDVAVYASGEDAESRGQEYYQRIVQSRLKALEHRGKKAGAEPSIPAIAPVVDTVAEQTPNSHDVD